MILCNFIKRAASLLHSKSRGYSKHLCLPLFLRRRWVLPLLFASVSDTQNAPTAQKMKFSIRDFSSKCDQIHRTLRIWSHLLKILNGKLHFLCSAHSGPGEAIKILWFQKKHWKYTRLWSAFLVDNVLEIELWQLQWNMS